MRIVIDARISGTTTGRYCDKLIEYLSKLQPNHDIIILTKKHRVKYLESIAPGFQIVESNYKEFSFGEQLGFVKQLYSLKADLVHFTMVQQPILYFKPKVTSMLDLTTFRYRNPTKNRFVYTVKLFVYKWVNRIAAKRSKHIITISEYVKNELVKTFNLDKDRLTTTYCAADKIDEPAKEYKKLKDSEFLLYVGRPQPHKNLEKLLDALSILTKKYPDLKLALVGKNDALFERLKAAAGKKGVDGSVVFTDFVSEEELRWLYENAKAYVFPSLSEGFGMPALEAMVHGCPVVSSNATCLPEIYGNAAHYFAPTSPKDMAEKIDEVLTNSKLRSRLIKNGRARVHDFSWRKMAEQTLTVYNNYLGRS